MGPDPDYIAFGLARVIISYWNDKLVYRENFVFLGPGCYDLAVIYSLKSED